MRHIKKYYLEFTAFTSGGVVMIYELVGSRLIAPYLGTSIYVWSSLIGVILLSLSLGYWLGGKIADKNPEIKTLSKLILLGSFFITINLIIQAPLLDFIQFQITQKTLTLGIGTFIANLILFTPASLFMGMVTPYAVKLKMEKIEKAGRTVGNLYAISTIGSIVGTFSAGFLLIPFFGTTTLIGIISIILLVLSAFLYPAHLKNIKISPIYVLILITLALFFSLRTINAAGFIDIDTPYNRVWVVDETHNNRQMRFLKTSPQIFQSGIFLDNPEELVSSYTQFFTLFKHFNPNTKNILMIGGGAFVYTQYHQKTDPEINMDIVEIDPKLTEIAKEYFYLKDSPNINIINEDGRTFINQSQNKYDTLFLDAFTSIYSIPYSLTTIEAVQKYSDLLNEDGVILVNIISAIEGEKSLFLQAEYKTFTQVFPQVLIYQPTKQDSTKVQSIVLVALKSKTPPTQESPLQYGKMLSTLWTAPINTNLPTLTDNFAPVDYYAEKMAN